MSSVSRLLVEQYPHRVKDKTPNSSLYTLLNIGSITIEKVFHGVALGENSRKSDCLATLNITIISHDGGQSFGENLLATGLQDFAI